MPDPAWDGAACEGLGAACPNELQPTTTVGLSEDSIMTLWVNKHFF